MGLCNYNEDLGHVMQYFTIEIKFVIPFVVPFIVGAVYNLASA